MEQVEWIRGVARAIRGSRRAWGVDEYGSVRCESIVCQGSFVIFARTLSGLYNVYIIAALP